MTMLSSQPGARLLLNIFTAILCTVIASCGGGGGSSTSSTGSSTPANLSATQSKPSANPMGINISAPHDWNEDRLYANVITMSRSFIKGTDANDTAAGLAPVDAGGWPTSDFSFYVWHGIGNMHGTYTLSFKGQATVTGSYVGTINLSYDSSTNTSTGIFQYTPISSAYLSLSFTDTKRSAGSALGSGVSAIKLMRPLTPGASQSYPPSALFTDPIKALISKFGVVRFMDFLAINANVQTHWRDRKSVV